MLLSNTSQYAIRTVSYMAIEKNTIYAASYLVQKLNISDKYLKRILNKLTEKEILKSIQGRYGGYRLAKKPENITLIEIIEAVEDKNKYFKCFLGFEYCSDEKPCLLHSTWLPIRNQIITFLTNTSLNYALLQQNKIVKI